MKKILITLTICVSLFLGICLKASSTEGVITLTPQYKNVILFIGDGMGPNHVDAGEIYLGKPFCFNVTNDKWTYHAYSNTDSLTSQGFTLDESKSLILPELNKSLYDGTPSPYDSSVSLGVSGNITCYTDSAAGGTALATGVKVTNSRLGMDIEGNDLANIVEIAKGLGKKAGVVTSDEVVGATPASFASHVGERHLAADILDDMANGPINLILGKTTDEYKNNTAKYETLFKNKGFDLAYNRSGLNSDSDRLFGVFPGVANKQDPRIPSLEELTVFALDYLDNEEGFFLMVEGAQIDKHSHSHQTTMMLKELLGFNDAVGAAQDWAAGRDDTVILVTADHETGGLYYDRTTTTQETILNDIKWLTYNHSRTRVDIAIYGDINPYLNKYGNNFKTLEGLPYWDNTDVFKFCAWHLAN